MEIPLVQDILVICALSLGVVLVSTRFGIPPIVGFLFTGVIAGPHGLALVNAKDVNSLAEVGIVCLLFTIGLEFSLSNLSRIKRLVLLGGGVQVALTVAFGVLLGLATGLALNQAVFLGFLLCLSSTAIVLKILQQRGETESPHGNLILGTLIFQDIIVAPMLLITPILAGKGAALSVELPLLGIKVAVLLGVVYIFAKRLVPWALFKAAKVSASELFMVGVILVALAVTVLSEKLGLSVALGAFLAGLIVSESEYNHRALGSVLPLRDLFASFFFVSMGMLFNVKYVMGNLTLIAGLAVVVIFAKFIGAAVSSIVVGFPLRTTVLTGVCLCQIGEFSFVLSKSGWALGLMEADLYQAFVGVAVLSMTATPFLIAEGEKIASWFLKLPLPDILKAGLGKHEPPPKKEPLKNHVIIVGYGLNGKNLNEAVACAGIPRIIIELNPQTVMREKADGQPIFYGDASQPPALEHADIHEARVLVIVISDPAATRRIIDTARILNPSIYIIAGTRFKTLTDSLYDLGADEVIPEDYEASLETLSRVLNKYLIPTEDIERFARKIRSEHYKVFQGGKRESFSMSDLNFQLSDTEISVMRVHPEAEAVGKTLADLDMRNRLGINVLAVRKQDRQTDNPSGATRLEAHDVLILLGEPQQIAEISGIIRPKDKGRDAKENAPPKSEG